MSSCGLASSAMANRTAFRTAEPVRTVRAQADAWWLTAGPDPRGGQNAPAGLAQGDLRCPPRALDHDREVGRVAVAAALDLVEDRFADPSKVLFAVRIAVERQLRE